MSPVSRERPSESGHPFPKGQFNSASLAEGCSEGSRVSNPGEMSARQ
jgi:hypothetical protein